MDNILNIALRYPKNSYIFALKGVLNKVKPALKQQNLILVLIAGISFGFLPLFHFADKAQADMDSAIKAGQILTELSASLALAQENSLLAVASPNNPEPDVVRKLRVVVTAYSSTPWETDSTPFVTASGKGVKKGIVANNLLPFGTKIRMPELYGDQIFIVEDRMSWKTGNYQIDIWFPSHQTAENFGAKWTYIEVLES